MEVRNLIFDFDGTLADTAPVILSTMAATIRELRLPYRSEDECRATIGLRLESVPAAMYPGHEDLSKVFAATYRRIFNEINREVPAKPFPHVIDLIRELKGRGFGLAIASSRSHQSLVDFTEELDICGMFDMLIGGNDVEKGKPAPDQVIAICSRLKWNVEETLVVGDACFDIEMGKNAGAITCAVTYGNQSREQLLESRPDFIIDSFIGLNDILIAASTIK